MAASSSGRAQYTVACACGTVLTLDARGFGRPKPCRSCGALITVAWGRDPRSRKTVPVAMTQAPKSANRGRGGPAPGGALCSCAPAPPDAPGPGGSPSRCSRCGKPRPSGSGGGDPAPQNKIQKFERIKPSAPLLPLHMRAPLRVKIKPGALFFDCVCGERVLIRAGTEGRPIQCPACDRFHIVESQGVPPPGPAPEPGAAPRGAVPAPPRPLGLGEFLCKCGEIQPPRTSRTGRDFSCKKCGRKGHVEMDRDPQTGIVKMRPIFTSEPAAGPSSAASDDSPVPPPSTPAWTCTCGRAIEAHVVLSAHEATCPGCGRSVRLEKWRHPHSTMTMIRPVFGEPAASARREDAVVSFTELEPAQVPAPIEAAVFEVSAGSAESDAPPPVGADATIAPCECGAELIVSPSDVGQTIQCPACADLMVVERAKGSYLLRALRAGVDTSDWELDEFK